jgi:hypothetical protein
MLIEFISQDRLAVLDAEMADERKLIEHAERLSAALAHSAEAVQKTWTSDTAHPSKTIDKLKVGHGVHEQGTYCGIISRSTRMHCTSSMANMQHW